MTTTAPSGTTQTHHVRTDLVVGGALIAVTMLGRLLWQASEAGLFDTFGAR